MALEIPVLKTDGSVVGATHLYSPEDFIWISFYGETPEYWNKLRALPFVLDPAQVVASINKENEATLSELCDGVENLFERAGPEWWTDMAIEEKEEYMAGMRRQIPRWRLSVDDPGSVLAIGTVAIYTFMASPLWKPHFLGQQVPWEDYVEAIEQ